MKFNFCTVAVFLTSEMIISFHNFYLEEMRFNFYIVAMFLTSEIMISNLHCRTVSHLNPGILKID